MMAPRAPPVPSRARDLAARRPSFPPFWTPKLPLPLLRRVGLRLHLPIPGYDTNINTLPTLLLLSTPPSPPGRTPPQLANRDPLNPPQPRTPYTLRKLPLPQHRCTTPSPNLSRGPMAQSRILPNDGKRLRSSGNSSAKLFPLLRRPHHGTLLLLLNMRLRLPILWGTTPRPLVLSYRRLARRLLSEVRGVGVLVRRGEGQGMIERTSMWKTKGGWYPRRFGTGTPRRRRPSWRGLWE